MQYHQIHRYAKKLFGLINLLRYNVNERCKVGADAICLLEINTNTFGLKVELLEQIVWERLDCSIATK